MSGDLATGGPKGIEPSSAPGGSPSEGWEPSATLEGLRAAMAAFAAERDWQQFHTPRNLLLALTGEVGELAELFQWRGEVAPGLPAFSAAERVAVGEELSDVLLYLVRLSDSCGIDLGAAAQAKMGKNRAKYPADLCRGSSRKYTELGGRGAAASGGGGGAEGG